MSFRRREANLQKGRQLLREGKVSEARDCFTRCVNITPAMAHNLIKVWTSHFLPGWSKLYQCLNSRAGPNKSYELWVEKTESTHFVSWITALFCIIVRRAMQERQHGRLWTLQTECFQNDLITKLTMMEVKNGNGNWEQREAKSVSCTDVAGEAH